MIRVKLYSLTWKFTLRAIALISWLVSIIWLVYSPSFDALIALLGCVGLFIGSFAVSDVPREISKKVEARLSSSENTFVWYPSKRDRYGLPEGLPSIPRLYISRHQFEKELHEALVKYQIVSLEGLSGMGKTDLAIKVLHEIKQRKDSKNDKCRVIFFDTQPEISILNALLEELSGQNHPRFALEYLDQENSILVIDNFQSLNIGYHQLLENVLKYTENLRILFISRTRNDLVFPDYPSCFEQVIVSSGFNEPEAKQFIREALQEQNFSMSDDEFSRLYKNSGFGIPRILANYVATLRKSLKDINYFDFFEFDKPENALKNSAKKLLSTLKKQEVELIECISVVPTSIEKDRLVLLYNHLYPLRSFFTPHKESAVLGMIKKLTDEYVIDLRDSNTVKVHDSMREVISQFPNQITKAHQRIAKFYISPYELRPYNPDTISAKELTDKWNAVYHCTMGRMYEEAANILSEIHPFLSQSGLQEGADVYLEELYRVLKFKVPWVAFLYAYRMFEKGNVNEACEIVDEVIKQKVDARFNIRVLTLRVEILTKLGKEGEAFGIAKSNIEVLKNVIKSEDDLTYDANLDNILAWNLRILANISTLSGDTQKAEDYIREASEVSTQVPLKKAVAKAKSMPGILPIGIPTLTFASAPEIEYEDANEVNKKDEPVQKRRPWLHTLLVYLILILCLGLAILYRYDQNRLETLYDARELEFTQIMINIQNICSSASISEATQKWSERSQISYRVGRILIYDYGVGIHKISRLHHQALTDDMRAQTPNDLGTVFCFSDEKVWTGNTYQTVDGVVSGLEYVINWNIIGFNWKNGKVISYNTLTGKRPPFYGVLLGDLIGPPPSSSDLKDWIISLPEK